MITFQMPLRYLMLAAAVLCITYVESLIAAPETNISPPPFISPVYRSNDKLYKFECFIPSDFKTEAESSNRLAYAVGMATIYPRVHELHGEFEELEQCLFGWYVSKKFWLASFTWDTTHALFKLMSADPEQFFRVIQNNKPEGYSAWVRSFEHAQLWGMSEECPNPTPLAQAARSISGFNFPDAEMERMRIEVLDKLKTLKCNVPE